MTAPRIGVGLVSWNGISFVRGRSRLLPTSTAAPTERSVIPGQLYKVDRFGGTVAPFDLTLVYEYLIMPITTLYDVQTQYDALYQKFLSSPVGTLITFAAGDYTVQMSGRARLEEMPETAGAENYKVLNLKFFLEQGMVG